MKRLAIATVFTFTTFTVASASSPYTGEERQDIKALSVTQVDEYLAGKGMGYAKAAELNHYPGPKHVLELASELKLTAEQRKQIETISTEMESNAKQLGKKIVDQERQLDRAFVSGDIVDESLRQRLNELARLQAELRYTHLRAHLTTRMALTSEQIKQYDALRGYSAGTANSGEHHHRH